MAPHQSLERRVLGKTTNMQSKTCTAMALAGLIVLLFSFSRGPSGSDQPPTAPLTKAPAAATSSSSPLARLDQHGELPIRTEAPQLLERWTPAGRIAIQEERPGDVPLFTIEGEESATQVVFDGGHAGLVGLDQEVHSVQVVYCTTPAMTPWHPGPGAKDQEFFCEQGAAVLPLPQGTPSTFVKTQGRAWTSIYPVTGRRIEGPQKLDSMHPGADLTIDVGKWAMECLGGYGGTLTLLLKGHSSPLRMQVASRWSILDPQARWRIRQQVLPLELTGLPLGSYSVELQDSAGSSVAFKEFDLEGNENIALDRKAPPATREWLAVQVHLPASDFERLLRLNPPLRVQVLDSKGSQIATLSQSRVTDGQANVRTFYKRMSLDGGDYRLRLLPIGMEQSVRLASGVMQETTMTCPDLAWTALLPDGDVSIDEVRCSLHPGDAEPLILAALQLTGEESAQLLGRDTSWVTASVPGQVSCEAVLSDGTRTRSVIDSVPGWNEMILEKPQTQRIRLAAYLEGQPIDLPMDWWSGSTMNAVTGARLVRRDYSGLSATLDRCKQIDLHIEGTGVVHVSFPSILGWQAQQLEIDLDEASEREYQLQVTPR